MCGLASSERQEGGGVGGGAAAAGGPGREAVEDMGVPSQGLKDKGIKAWCAIVIERRRRSNPKECKEVPATWYSRVVHPFVGGGLAGYADTSCGSVARSSAAMGSCQPPQPSFRKTGGGGRLSEPGPGSGLN